MYKIKQSTGITVPLFIHDAAGDPVTGLVDGGFTLKRISKNGAAFGAMAVTITEMENGWYSIPLSAAHSDTLGLLTLVFQGASGKQVNLQWRVEAKLTDDLNDLAQADILDDATPFSGGDIDAAISTRSDFDETANPVELLDSGGAAGTSADELVNDIWNEDIVAAHGGGDSAGLILRALGALISQRANNATLEELLGIADAVGRDMPEQVWLEGTRDLTALGFNLDTADFVAAFLDSTLIAANAIGASQLATDAGQEIADRILARSLATGADGGRTVQDALRLLRNLRQIVAGVLTVMEEDDATPAWTAVVSTAAGNPVDSIDPA